MRTMTLARNPHLRTALLVLATLLASAAPMTAAADTAYLEFSSDGLEPLGPGFVYEGWIIVDGAAVSAGRFSVKVPSVVEEAADVMNLPIASNGDAVVTLGDVAMIRRTARSISSTTEG